MRRGGDVREEPFDPAWMNDFSTEDNRARLARSSPASAADDPSAQPSAAAVTITASSVAVCGRRAGSLASASITASANGDGTSEPT